MNFKEINFSKNVCIKNSVNSAINRSSTVGFILDTLDNPVWVSVGDPVWDSTWGSVDGHVKDSIVNFVWWN